MAGTESVWQKKGKMKQLLTEAITMLCKNSLSFCEELTVEGLIGITIDKQDVLLVNMNETLHGNEAASWSEASPEDCSTLNTLDFKYKYKKVEVAEKVPTSECNNQAAEGMKKLNACWAKEDLQKLDVHSTRLPKVVEDRKCERINQSLPAPRRKQRKPVQIKEEASELVLDEDVDDADVWQTFGKMNHSSHTASAGKETASQDISCQEDQEFVVLEMGGPLQPTDKKRVPADLVSFYPGAQACSSSSNYGCKDMGQVVSLKSEGGTILSVPSPKSIYNSMKILGATATMQQPSSAVDGAYSHQIEANSYDDKSYRVLTEGGEDTESCLVVTGEQIYTGGSVTEATPSDMPMDLSLEGANQQQQQQIQQKDQPTRAYRRRSRLSYSHTGKEIVNAHGAVRCPVCRKWFDSRIKYNRHKRSHRGIFTCTVCGRAYNRKDNMQRHHKLYHSEYLQDGDSQSLMTQEEDGYTHTAAGNTQFDDGDEIPTSP